MEDIDTVTGGEDLTIDQAAAAYAKVTASNEADTGQSEDDETTQSDETTDDELQASDEDEGEEATGEDEPEGQPEDEEGEEPETERGRYVAHNGRVKLPDGTESTIAELIAGNMKERDYRQKTMELAPLREETKAQSAALKERETQLEQQREYVAQLIQTIIPEMPSPDLLTTDPQAYLQQRALAEQWQQHLQYLHSQQQQTAQARQAETEKQAQERIAKEWDTALEKLPVLKDPKQLEAFGKDTLKYGAEYGYTSEELARIHHDHRNLLVMSKAIKWDKLQASKPAMQKKVEGRPPVQKGGKRLSPSENNARNGSEAFSRLKQSGSVNDGVAAYLALKPKG